MIVPPVVASNRDQLGRARVDIEGAYRLPPEHAACLTRAARPDNLAVTAQWIPVLAGVVDQIVACFEVGGGVPYSEFPRFHQANGF